MTKSRTYEHRITAAAVAVLLFSGAALAQSVNPWNPYPSQQGHQAPPATATSKYYQDTQVNGAGNQNTAPSPSRFAPADLDQRLSTPPPPRMAAPFGYTPSAAPPYPYGPQNGQQSFGPQQGYFQGGQQGYRGQNFPMNGSGYGPPIIGNTSWGNVPRNNVFPFGF